MPGITNRTVLLLRRPAPWPARTPAGVELGLRLVYRWLKAMGAGTLL
ncbi:MAG: hypothetical protein M1119_01455 [Firmicutes bacterium]|nr:hypothetical protein [Bacillota bacterium]